MPWTGFHRREARDLPWAVGRREKPFSLEEESGRSHRVPGGTARGGGPTQFQHNQDRPDASGPREHRLQGRLPAGAPVAEGAGAPCPFSRRQGPLPGFYGQALPQPSLAFQRYPYPPRMATDQRLCGRIHGRPFCYLGKSLGVPLPPQPPHHAPLTGPPLQLPRRAPFHKNQVEILCSALFRFPRKSSAVTSPQRAVRKGERETRWPEIPPHPTRRPSTGPIPKTHLPTGNSKDMPSAEEFRQHDARHGTPQSRHKPWNLLKPPQAKDSPGLVAGHESPRQVAGHESPRQVAGHESPTSGRTAGRGPTTCQRAAPGNFPMNKPHPEPKPPSPPKTPKPAPQPSAPPEPPLMNPTTLR